MNTIKRSERGQVMAMIAMSAIVLVGFAGLAIDGGMVFADRRHAQNAADASALAGAGLAALYMDNDLTYYDNFSCGSASLTAISTVAVDTAINRAFSNDYSIDADISDHHGVAITCVEDGSSGGYVDRYLDVKVDVTRTTSTSLIHVVYQGPVQNQVEAVARLRPRVSLGFGNAIAALNDAPCSGNSNGLILSGSSESYVIGGGMLSNGCLYGNGNNFTVDVTDGSVVYGGELAGTTSNINPAPEPMFEPLPDWVTTIPAPVCTGLEDKGSSNSAGTIWPGFYSSISLHNGELTMKPGLYCITDSGTAFTANGGEIFADGVTLYLQNGGLTILGSVAPVSLRAPMYAPDPSPALGGVLIYLPEGNTSVVSITGNTDTYYRGMIYAPSGDVNIAGNNATNPTFHTQIVGYNVEISGSAVIDIKFDAAYNYMIPPMIDLQK